MDHDALGAHARDELGITEIVSARPVQAALTSAAAFAVGAALPLATVVAGADVASDRSSSARTSMLFLVGARHACRPAPAARRRPRGRRGSPSGARWRWLATAAVGRLFGAVF